jgi:hypothetical protein
VTHIPQSPAAAETGEGTAVKFPLVDCGPNGCVDHAVSASTEGSLCEAIDACDGLAACKALLTANTLVGSSLARQLQACNQIPTTVDGEVMAKGFHGHLVKKKCCKATACLSRLDAVGTSVGAAKQLDHDLQQPALEQKKTSDGDPATSLGNIVWVSKLQAPVMHCPPVEAAAHGLECGPDMMPHSDPQGGMSDALSLIGLGGKHEQAECICWIVVPVKVLLGATAAQSALSSSLTVPVSRLSFGG